MYTVFTKTYDDCFHVKTFVSILKTFLQVSLLPKTLVFCIYIYIYMYVCIVTCCISLYFVGLIQTPSIQSIHGTMNCCFSIFFRGDRRHGTHSCPTTHRNSSKKRERQYQYDNPQRRPKSKPSARVELATFSLRMRCSNQLS